jgi:hypothetical protein
MADPVVKQKIAVATNPTEPGSLIARSFAQAAGALALNELFAIRSPSPLRNRSV